MPTVHEKISLAATDIDLVYRNLTAIAEYPSLAPSVLSVDIDDETTSTWEVEFRGGTMRWTEHDEYVADEHTYRFSQLEGDLQSFDGEWRVETSPNGVLLNLQVNFDLGMPSLADLVNPVAERALLDNLRAIAVAVGERSQEEQAK